MAFNDLLNLKSMMYNNHSTNLLKMSLKTDNNYFKYFIFHPLFL
ncbi:hypothetical protein SAMN04487911_11056 [Arenibacter nanhaiticus]|uniref:Uncharacterized protein n=1 Tax=Arenibacter nanhaiticus TaxID=558155 RepID=A0A1M6G7L4_9FLAO|nr:hypothetical protein SAMN04487911_11056 [Arenibacter nanhaiticus]